MPDSLRITADELKRRSNAGEQFTFVDVRNPQAWAESNQKLPGAIRVPVDKLADHQRLIPEDKPIVTYCT